ncbi:hypothetical protein D3C72_1473420 [compost metagenome]
MCADLPPSSSTHLTALTAAACWISTPTSFDPVKVMKLMSAWRDRLAPASSPKPVTMFSAPGGKPTSKASSATRMMDRQASSAGLTTLALPMARAGATLRPNICAG